MNKLNNSIKVLGGCPRIEEPTAEKPFQSDSPIKCVKYTQLR